MTITDYGNLSNQNFSSLAFARKARGSSREHEWTNQIRFLLLFTKNNGRTLLTRFPRPLLSLSHAQKRRALGSRILWKDFTLKKKIAPDCHGNIKTSPVSLSKFYRFLTSSYQQTAIQAFGGHQNVHFHSEARLRTNVEYGRVGCSAFLIRFHLSKDIPNRNRCRCTKRHAGSRLAALSRIFFHYPGLLIHSRVTVFSIGWFLAGGRRGKKSWNRHEEFGRARTDPKDSCNSSRTFRVLKKKDISYPSFVFSYLHIFRFLPKLYPQMMSNKAIAHWTAKETKNARRLLGEPCFAVSNVSTGNSVMVPRSTVFPNLAAQKIDVRFSVVVMEFFSRSQRNFVSLTVHKKNRHGYRKKIASVISQWKFQQSWMLQDFMGQWTLLQDYN